MAASVQSQIARANRLLKNDAVAAKAIFADVLQRFPANVAAARGLGSNQTMVSQTLASIGRVEQAVDWIDHSKNIDPVEGCRLKGSALLMAGRVQDAVHMLEPVMEGADASLWNHYGSALRMLGQGENARKAYRNAVSLSPNHVQSWYNLANTKGTDEADVVKVGDLLKTATGDEKALLHFTLGITLDRIEQYDNAFASFSAGNAMRKQSFGYDIRADQRLFEHLKTRVPPPLDVAPASCRPIFIIGLPRSGTTLLEQRLAQHPAISAGGELTALSQAIQAHDGLNSTLTPDRLHAIRATYLEARPSSDAGFLVDKMPLNFRLVALAAAALPDAIFVHISRDPIATCWSNYRRYFSDNSLTNGFAWNLQDLGYYHTMYTDLMAHWRTVLPGRLHELSYEDFVDDPQRHLSTLLRHMDLEWDPACLWEEIAASSVQTASALQVREGIYKNSNEAWRHYEAHLGPLIEILGKTKTSSIAR